MPRPEIEQFGRDLVHYVRDLAIQNMDGQLRRWKKAARDRAVNELLQEVIVDCVDTAVFYLLLAIDQGGLQLSLNLSDGSTVNLTQEGLGELAGWYMGGEDGWCTKYSKERLCPHLADYHPDFSDLTDTPE